ncbi:hypothetical protein GIB67_043072 [Kingdonia uniflora]|uniref:RING-type domain-containing protein n=1 Tax=Kingdonia uniflora TaxID=39325 RepID=A0A7J7M9V5_9MAGN|nr:hypothetical protein GIB67_043072 [Kingdonia uniflora]
MLFTANGIQDFHLVDQIICYGEMLTDFVPTVGGFSLAEALAFKKATAGVPGDIVAGQEAYLHAFLLPPLSSSLTGREETITRLFTIYLMEFTPQNAWRTCGVCSKLLAERSSWNCNELSVTAILFCGHVYHAECLENMMSEIEKHDRTCPLCISGEKEALKISKKSLGINSRISRNHVLDDDLVDDSVSYGKSSGSEEKCPKIGSSSSVRNVFTKPFMKCHFLLGSKKMIRSMTENESPVRRKGFWDRYRWK